MSGKYVPGDFVFVVQTRHLLAIASPVVVRRPDHAEHHLGQHHARLVKLADDVELTWRVLRFAAT